MNRIILHFVFCFVSITSLSAQIPPQAFNYSAVARNVNGQPIATSTIGIQVSILKTSTVGAVQYSENHFVNTDAFGLFNLVIGAGAVQSGNMSGINWEDDNYYLKVGMDTTGGTNFLTMGTTQLLSVPYALHAKTATSLVGGGTGFSGDYNDLVNKPIVIDSISVSGDTLYLSNGQTFVSSTLNSNSLVTPSLTISAVAEIGTNSAKFSANLTNVNSNQIVSKGFVFGMLNNPTLNTNGSEFFYVNGDISDFSDTVSLWLNPNTTYYVRAFATTENGINFYSNEESFTTQQVGQLGPAGGYVFYNKGNNNDGWQFLEAASNDQITNIQWGCINLNITGTEYGIGNGSLNTGQIVAQCNDPSFAAKIADNLILGGNSDWFLPSNAEMMLIHMNLYLNGLGNFNPALPYWTSTQVNNELAISIDLNTGLTYPSLKSENYSVRAIRAY